MSLFDLGVPSEASATYDLPAELVVTQSEIQSELGKVLAQGRELISQLQAGAMEDIRRVRSLAAQSVWRSRRRARKILTSRVRDEFCTMREGKCKELQEVIKNALAECLELSLKIAREIVKAELVSNRDSLPNRIESALSRLHDAAIEKINLHQDDLSIIGTALQLRFPGVVLGKTHVVPKGDALVESSQGKIEIDHELQLERLAARLRQKLRTELDGESKS